MSDGRSERVLEAALETFARYGYRKTAMEDVARAADISRPGLYFLFDSKPNLFRAAVTHALDQDVEAARRALSDEGRPLRDRLIEAFDLWTGRYIGPMAREVAVLRESQPELLGPIVEDYPRRFAAMIAGAVGSTGPAADVTRTLLSLATGIKHEVATREEFVARMSAGVDLLLRALDCRTRHASRS